MKPINFRFKIPSSGFLRLAAVLLGLSVAGAVRAQEPIYQNFSVLDYTVPGFPPPTIDATIFDNENQFNVNFVNQLPASPLFYEPENAVIYTNNSSGINTGIMTVNSPPTNILNIATLSYNTVGVGFQFDTLTPNTLTHQMAGTFYNGGDIRCDSVLDGNNLATNTFAQTSTFVLFNVGQCLVWATNIVCPGSIDTSEDGLIQLTGQNVDLTRSVLNMEQGMATANILDGDILSEGEGFDIGAEWNPARDLTATTARSSAPDPLVLTNSTPYYGLVSGAFGNLYRSVFIQNQNPSVSYTVYVAPAQYNNEGALIQWAGTYIDPASGRTLTNYLYLYHFYFNPSITNFSQIVEFGTPVTAQDELDYEFGLQNFYNFVWSQSTPIAGLGTPNAPNFPAVFNNSFFTNIYEYFNADLTASTVSTNVTPFNPSGALTNLPARIQITANQDLKLSLAYISGANYLSLIATNQFDGSPGAQIAIPYADINLGVTNGVMTVSNLVAQNIPSWSGLLQEWSTSWTNQDANSNLDDIRVMLVNSDLTPTLYPQVQNLTLNVGNTLAPNSTTNSLVISDVLNVFGSLYATPQSLTITTNGINHGANSTEGTLNLLGANPLSWSWSGSFPNLLWLTNNGSIFLPNYSDFIGNTNVVSTNSGTAAIPATATLSESGGTNVPVNGTVTVGALTYTFTNIVNGGTPPNEVKVGTTFAGSLSNLIAAINGGAGVGTLYSDNTFANSTASAGLLAGTNFTVSANANNYPGTFGNGIPVATTATNLSWSGTFLSGGANAVPGSTNVTPTSIAYGAIVNNGILVDQGSTMWANYFLSDGVISNGVGPFILNAQSATLTNGTLTAGGSVSITANTLVTSNLLLQAGASLSLQVTNLLTDTGITNLPTEAPLTNGNFWYVGAANGTGNYGLNLPIKPAVGDLLRTEISFVAPGPNKPVYCTWAATNAGASTFGYTNNAAIGQLTLNAVGLFSSFNFSGVGVSNAIYVDQLVLTNFAALTNNLSHLYISALNINTNLVIYYADALSSGQDVSYIINGFNTDAQGHPHLVWVPEYAGYFSSTNLVYPDGTTNTLNVGLAQDPNLDSNGDGIPNNLDSEPVFIPTDKKEVNFKFAMTNMPTPIARLSWDSIPSATNTVYYSSNLMNWVSVYTNVEPSAVPPANGWPMTNIIYEPLHMTMPHGFYHVIVSPNPVDVYGQ